MTTTADKQQILTDMIGEENGCFTIIATKATFGGGVVLAFKRLPETCMQRVEYVTWLCFPETGSFFSGHYTHDFYAAARDFQTRVF